MDGRKPLLEYDALERTVEETDPIGGCGMKEGLKSLTLLGHPKTGPRRTLPTAKESQDLGRQRRYPVLGWPSSCIWKNFTPLTTMINLLNLTDTTSAKAPACANCGGICGKTSSRRKFVCTSATFGIAWRTSRPCCWARPAPEREPQPRRLGV